MEQPYLFNIFMPGEGQILYTEKMIKGALNQSLYNVVYTIYLGMRRLSQVISQSMFLMTYTTLIFLCVAVSD